jgi:hypothetical protein
MIVMLLLSIPANAATLEVGHGKLYPTLQAANDAAAAGDTIVVGPGTYERGAKITKDRLLIRGAGQDRTLFDGGVVNAKGILHITADDVTVSALTLQNAKSRYVSNAAGIRQEGRNLTVSAVTFKDNDNGILYTAVSKADRNRRAAVGERGRLSIGMATFDGNGHGDGQSHGVYASIVDDVVVFQSTFKNTRVGHHLKSRAQRTKVTHSSFYDGSVDKGASYAIDLPQGGAAEISGNNFVKGANASNPCCVIAYGFEMKKGVALRNPLQPVIVTDNSVRSELNGRVRFFANRSTPRNSDVKLAGNRLTTPRALIQ